MPDISKITLPSGTTYDIKDPVARQGAAGALIFRGVTETEITDGSSASTYIVGEETVTARNGDLIVYGTKEFLYSTVDNKWHEMGDNSALRALAYKDNASGSVTPTGSVSVSSAGATTTVNSITDVGSLPAWTATVSNETLTIAWSQGTLPVKGSDTTVKTGDAAYAFSGDTKTVTVS